MRRRATPLFSVLFGIALAGTNGHATVIFSDNFALDFAGSGHIDATVLSGNPNVTWTVVTQTTSPVFTGDVDLIGNGVFPNTICTSTGNSGATPPSTGAGGSDPCHDLAGSSIINPGTTAGAFLRSNGFSLTGGVLYTFIFEIAGSQRGNSNSVTAGFMDGSNNFLQTWSSTLTTTTPFEEIDLNYTPLISQTAYLFFQDTPGTVFATGNSTTCAGGFPCAFMGALVNNVSLSNNQSQDVTPEPGTAALFGLGIAGLAAFSARRRAAARK